MQSDVSAFQDEEAFPELGGWGKGRLPLHSLGSQQLNRDLELPDARAVSPKHLVGIRRFTTLGVIPPKTLTVGGLGGHPMMGMCHQVFQTF